MSQNGTLLTPADAPSDTPEQNDRKYGSVGLEQAYMLRELAFNQALALQDAPLSERETAASRAQATASLVKAWDTACDRARICKGRGLPKGVVAANDPSRKSSKRKPVITGPIGPSA